MIGALQLATILFCLVGHAFFAGIETGVISIHRLRLQHFVRQGVRGTRILQKFLQNPDRLLGTTLVGTNLCVVAMSVTAASMAVTAMGKWGQGISAAVVAMVILIMGEYLPKTWFHSRPIERCRRFARLLRFSEAVFRPASVAIVWLTRWLVPGPAKSFPNAVPFVTKEDLKVLAHEGEQHGVLSPEERVMIHRVFELSHKRAHQIMIPRAEMTTVNSDTSIGDFFSTARQSCFTRMPVYDLGQEQFVGIINVFHVLSAKGTRPEQTVAEFARPPLFIREDMPVDEILPRLRRFRQPMCLVRNEAGAVTGLVTTEDILEEIVGNL